MNDIRPRFPEHCLEAVERCRNSIALLESARPIQIEVAGGNSFNELGEGAKSRSMTVSDIPGAKERGTESSTWGYVA